MENVSNYTQPEERAFGRIKKLNLRCMCGGKLELIDNVIVDAEHEYRAGSKVCTGVDYGYVVQCARCRDFDTSESISGLIKSLREFQLVMRVNK